MQRLLPPRQLASAFVPASNFPIRVRTDVRRFVRSAGCHEVHARRLSSTSQTSPGAATDEDMLMAYERRVISVVESVGPAVVSITSSRSPDGAGPPAGAGSGFFFASDGYLITNDHVAATGTAGGLRAKLTDGREFVASAVGTDPATDIAVLRLHTTDGVPVVPIGDSSSLSVGQVAIAIGNPLGFESTVSTAIIAGAQNISFSVPMHSVEWVASQILQHGRVRRGYFGMAGAARPLSREMQRKLKVDASSVIEVMHVEEGGPAAAGGLQPGDWIVAFNGTPVPAMDDLYRLMSANPPSAEVMVTVVRNQASALNVKVVLGEDVGSQAPASSRWPMLGAGWRRR